MNDNLPIILFETEQDWIEWLERSGNEPGVWVRIAKKNSGLISVSYQQALDVALCFGWIDGLKNKFDETSFIQRFTARKPKSNWSKINKEKAKLLIAEGKMRPFGIAAIENAKKSGAWDHAYDSHKNSKVPEDLEKALKDNLKALEFFETLNNVNRYAILYRIQIAKTEKLRAEKIRYFVDMLNSGEKIYDI